MTTQRIPTQKKFNSADDVRTALEDIAALRDRLDWRQRDMRLMFIQSPDLGQYYEAFQMSGGVTADEWVAFVASISRGRTPRALRPGVRRKAHIRMLVNNQRRAVRASNGDDAA